MVGTFRLPAQSLVGASKTTSTSVPLAASRSINERSAKSTSGITLSTLPLPGRRDDGTMVRLRGTAHCPKGHSDRCRRAAESIEQQWDQPLGPANLTSQSDQPIGPANLTSNRTSQSDRPIGPAGQIS